MYYQLAIIYEYFTYANTLYVSLRSERGFPSASSYYPNLYSSCFITDTIIPNVCVIVVDILNDLGI